MFQSSTGKQTQSSSRKRFRVCLLLSFTKVLLLQLETRQSMRSLKTFSQSSQKRLQEIYVVLREANSHLQNSLVSLRSREVLRPVPPPSAPQHHGSTAGAISNLSRAPTVSSIIPKPEKRVLQPFSGIQAAVGPLDLPCYNSIANWKETQGESWESWYQWLKSVEPKPEESTPYRPPTHFDGFIPMSEFKPPAHWESLPQPFSGTNHIQNRAPSQPFVDRMANWRETQGEEFETWYQRLKHG